MMEPPLTSKVLRAPNLKRGQENIRIQNRVSDNNERYTYIIHITKINVYIYSIIFMIILLKKMLVNFVANFSNKYQLKVAL